MNRRDEPRSLNFANDQEPEQLPPHNIEAEAGLLGAMMMDNLVIEEMLAIVTPEDFFEPLHARIYRAIIKLKDRGRSVSPVTLRPLFEADPAMRDLGGIAYLGRLTGSGAAILHARDLALQVAELAASRRMIDAMLEGIERLREAQEDPVDIASGIEADLFSASARATVTRPFSARDAVRSVRDHAEDVENNRKPSGAMCKTIPQLNALLGPAVPGRYNILGGRPGMGKSALLGSAMLGFALNQHPVEVFLAEMDPIGQHARFVSDLSLWLGRPIGATAIMNGNLTPREKADLDEIERFAEMLPINFNLVGKKDIRAIRGMIKRADAKWERAGKPKPIIGIDYIQILNASQNGKLIEDEWKKVTAISSALVDIAGDGHWVLALSQLGRHVDDRKNKRPMMSDLKQSASLENDADSVTFVYREEYYLNKERAGIDEKEKEDFETHLRAMKGVVEFSVPKNRWGPEGMQELRFTGEHYAIRGKGMDSSAGRQDDFDLGSY